MKKCILSWLIIMLSFCFCGCFVRYELQNSPFGVWWWNDELDNSYLDFAKNNGVNEIYYCSSKFNEQTSEFISLANKKGIKVYYLAGEKEWVNNSEDLVKDIEKYINYQQNFSCSKFDGIHLDIEPHQFDDFLENRKEYLIKLVTLCYEVNQLFPQITFDYDIPFWIHDEITFNGETLPAYAHIIKYANRTFIMSYRDTAEKIYDVAKEEIAYALGQNKILVLGVETLSSEGDSVSFMEEGKTYMNEQIAKLKQLINANFGISIHQIKTWFDLKD